MASNILKGIFDAPVMRTIMRDMFPTIDTVLKTWDSYATGGVNEATWDDLATGGSTPTTWADLES